MGRRKVHVFDDAWFQCDGNARLFYEHRDFGPARHSNFRAAMRDEAIRRGLAPKTWIAQAGFVGFVAVDLALQAGSCPRAHVGILAGSVNGRSTGRWNIAFGLDRSWNEFFPGIDYEPGQEERFKKTIYSMAKARGIKAATWKVPRSPDGSILAYTIRGLFL